MEIKKSPKADLERKKPLWFFIALVVNISFFVIVLEYSPSEGDVSVGDFAKSVENMAETTEMIAAETAAPATIEKNLKNEISASDEIEVVENTDVAEFVPPAAVVGNDSVEIHGADEIAEEKPLERTDVVTDLKLLDELPSYPGGMSKFVRWLTENIRYPENARKQRIQGLVLVSFVIGEDGNVSNLNIRKPLSKECDDEVMRVLKMMDKWTPGKRNGKSCRTMFCIPVEFKL